MTFTRRDLLSRSAAGAGIVFTGNLTGLFAGRPAVSARSAGSGYGPLVADPAELLDLPAGFSYRIVSQVGDVMPRGGVVPDRFDGMAAYAAADKAVVLVRNHEQSTSGVQTVAGPELTYDPGAWGGTTTVQIDEHGTKTGEYVSLAGTNNNCAGGLTPWGTWLTCEETEDRAGSRGGAMTKDHGFVFEVDPANPANNITPTPLTALGRFAHEAAVVDPATGVVYLTEDASAPNGLVYRTTPVNRSGGYGSLRAGGTLEAMRCTDGGVYVPDLSAYSTPGTVLTLGWVGVPDPLAATVSTRSQLAEITRSRKLEGAWWGNGVAYIVASFARATDGSVGQHDGQVWRLDPAAGTLTLDVHFGVTADQDIDPDGPDNITVSPWGGLILCEDGDGVQHLYAVAPDGSSSPLARNSRDDSEFAGACFSPDRKTLFANLQQPGITFAITGPFARIRRSG